MPRNPEPAADASGSVPVPWNPSERCWINELDRNVLLHILSCLDARQAVRTCVLSRRWRDLWRDAPRLNASRTEFELPNDVDYDARTLRFKKFVNRLLMLRNPVAMDDFRLSYSFEADVEGDASDAHLWIGHALLCGARSVEVSATDESDRLDLDPAVLTSERLTSLRFCRVVLDRGFFRQLQRGCQVLEVLILQDCTIDDIEIFSQTLKFLSIGRDCFFSFMFHDQASISAPSLTHFGFCGQGSHDIRIPLLKNMESLETAYILLDEFQAGALVDDISQLLVGLSGVTTLDFYYTASELEMAKNLQWCPKFPHLRFLTLGRWCLSADYYALIVFLQNAPNLVKLTLQLKKNHGPGIIGELEKRLFTCEHLKIVEIISWKRDHVVDSLEEFLLQSGITPGQIRIKH